MEEILNQIASLLGTNLWLGLLLAFGAGLLTSFTPCSLTSVSLVIGYVGGYTKEKKKAFKYSLVFSLGITITFTALGVIATLLGKMLSGTGKWFYIVLGVLMLIMTFQTWGLINIFPNRYVSTKVKKGYIGAFLLGVLGAVFSTPCSTPVLVAILALVSSGGNIISGIFMLLLYSIGHCLILVIAGTSVGWVNELSSSKKFNILSKIIKIIMGFILLFLAYYMFYQGLR
ncbi:MAG: cytochrome c biogenesis CcdA family protein [Anaeroplasmataceae bacterium]